MRFGDSWDAGHLFPPRELILTRADREQFETLADQLVAETLQASEEFIADRRSVDLERWKIVMEKGSMTVYRSRSRGQRRTRRDRLETEEAVESSFVHRPKLHSTDSSLSELMDRSHTHLSYGSSQDDSSSLGGSDCYENSRIDGETPEQSVLGKSRPPNTPMVFGGGVIPGTVDDAGLGFLADTEERSMMRAATSKELNVKDLRILAQLRGPTQQDPFRFLGIKWSSYSSTRGGVAKPRDVVVLESTGMTTDSTGERVCYFLTHSVDIEEVPEYRKQGLVRLRTSSCRIVRAYNSQSEVEVYFRGHCNAGGHFSVGASTQLFCEGLLDTAAVVEESYLKKLAWFVHAYARRQNHGDDDKDEGCACCHKLPTKGFKKLLESNTTCFLCRRKVCKKCTVKKHLPMDMTSKKSLDFCLTCYLKAKKLSAWRVAVATLPNV